MALLAHAVNKVVLLGKVGDRGVEVQFLPTGTACATFTLVVQEPGKEGERYSTYVSCEVYGKNAEAAGELEVGDMVLLDGRLRWRKGDEGKEGRLVVAGFEARKLEV